MGKTFRNFKDDVYDDDYPRKSKVQKKKLKKQAINIKNRRKEKYDIDDRVVDDDYYEEY